MITLEHGDAVARLLKRATSRPDLYSEVILCSPYIDVALGIRIRVLVRSAEGAKCAITVVTSPAGAAQLRAAFGDGKPPRSLRVHVRPSLHSKAYAIIARKGRVASEALVTSANLTIAGLSRNDELGVRAIADSPSGRALYAQISRSLQRLTTELQRSHI